MIDSRLIISNKNFTHNFINLKTLLVHLQRDSIVIIAPTTAASEIPVSVLNKGKHAQQGRDHNPEPNSQHNHLVFPRATMKPTSSASPSTIYAYQSTI